MVVPRRPRRRPRKHATEHQLDEERTQQNEECRRICRISRPASASNVALTMRSVYYGGSIAAACALQSKESVHYVSRTSIHYSRPHLQVLEARQRVEHGFEVGPHGGVVGQVQLRERRESRQLVRRKRPAHVPAVHVELRQLACEESRHAVSEEDGRQMLLRESLSVPNAPPNFYLFICCSHAALRVNDGACRRSLCPILPISQIAVPETPPGTQSQAARQTSFQNPLFRVCTGRAFLPICKPTVLVAGVADDVAEVGVGRLAVGLVDADPLTARQRPKLGVQQAWQAKKATLCRYAKATRLVTPWQGSCEGQRHCRGR